MNLKGRRTGIAAVAEVGWGTHICLFYHTKEDLFNILVPYFKAGLEDNEFCVWIFSPPLNEQVVREAMGKALPTLAGYLERGQLELIPSEGWYVKDGVVDSQRTIAAWIGKLEYALQRGYQGLRAAGDNAWLEKKDWEVHMGYEDAVNRESRRYPLIAICAYPLDRCDTVQLIQAVNNHHLTLIKDRDEWRMLERVERRRLKESEEMYSTLVEKCGDGIIVIQDGLLRFVNPAILKITGFSREEAMGKPFLAFVAPPYREWVAESYRRRMSGQPLKARYEVEILAKDGNSVPVEVDAQLISFGGKPADLAMLRDIRERKQAELLLRQSEERYRTLVENSIQGVLVVQDFRIVYCNQACADIFGGSVSELLSFSPQQVRAMIHPEDQGLVWGRYMARLTGEPVPARYEYRGIRKDGTIAWLEMLATRVVYNGKPAIMGTVIDITERKKAEEALRRSEEMYRSLVETLPGGVVLTDANGIVSFASRGMLELLGNPEESAVVGHSPLEWIAREHQEKARANIAAVLSGASRGYHSEYLMLKKDGTPFWVETHSSAVRDGKGQVIGVMAIVHDITSRKRMEEELKESEERYRSLFQNSVEAVFTSDLGGRITAGNRALEELTGYTLEELYRIDWKSMVSPASVEPILKAYNKVFSTHEPIGDIIYEIVRKDGEKRITQGFVAPLRKEGKIVGFQGTARDVTERRLAQQELERSREQLRNLARRIEAAREGERTLIAHELHDEMAQILTALKMDLSWLRKELPGDQGALHKRVESMSKLVDNAIQQVKGIVVKLRPSVLDDLGLAAALEWQASEFQDRTGIACRAHISPRDVAVDPAVATALFRIAQEALTNVARHAEATEVRIRLWRKAGKLFLQVKDNGKGISKEKLADPGSLGLLGMRERLLTWNGELKIRGIKGRGTTVTAIVPLEQGGGRHESAYRG